MTASRDGIDVALDQIELGLAGDQRHHDLRRDRLAAALGGLDRGLEDGARLHLGDLRIHDGEPAAAEAEHGVELGELADPIGEPAGIGPHGGGDLGDLRLAVRQEFVQRRIEQADRHRQAAP